MNLMQQRKPSIIYVPNHSWIFNVASLEQCQPTRSTPKTRSQTLLSISYEAFASQFDILQGQRTTLRSSLWLSPITSQSFTYSERQSEPIGQHKEKRFQEEVVHIPNFSPDIRLLAVTQCVYWQSHKDYSGGLGYRRRLAPTQLIPWEPFRIKPSDTCTPKNLIAPFNKPQTRNP